jgi:hypothetical protein
MEADITLCQVRDPLPLHYQIRSKDTALLLLGFHDALKLLTKNFIVDGS